MLAKNARTTQAFRQPALSLTSIASKQRLVFPRISASAHNDRRSEHAREKRQDNTGIQTARIIVDVHREQTEIGFPPDFSIGTYRL